MLERMPAARQGAGTRGGRSGERRRRRRAPNSGPAGAESLARPPAAGGFAGPGAPFRGMGRPGGRCPSGSGTEGGAEQANNKPTKKENTKGEEREGERESLREKDRDRQTDRQRKKERKRGKGKKKVGRVRAGHSPRGRSCGPSRPEEKQVRARPAADRKPAAGRGAGPAEAPGVVCFAGRSCDPAVAPCETGGPLTLPTLRYPT